MVALSPLLTSLQRRFTVNLKQLNLLNFYEFDKNGLLNIFVSRNNC